MIDFVYILGLNLFIVSIFMMLLWLASIPLKDPSFIDGFWSIGFIVIALSTFVMTPTTLHAIALLALTTLWGLRLSGYLLWRWRQHGMDKRYEKIMSAAKPGQEHWFSLRVVFGLQGALMLIISLPLQLGQFGSAPEHLGVIAWIGVGLSGLGIGLESLADWQLTRFKTNPDNTGKVMDQGLWRYTRHPNYFGDACVWWGLFLIAAETQFGIWSLAGPIIMTLLLAKWSGAGLLEKGLRKTKPGYEDYIARTNAFIPWFPKPAIRTDDV